MKTAGHAPPVRQLRALAIGAHPDDVEIHCMGLLLRLQAAGWTIGWAVASDGAAGLPPGTDPAVRAAEARSAGELVGVAPRLLDWSDGSVDDGPVERATLRALLDEARPDILITHNPGDYHPDHRAVARMVAAVCPVGTCLLEMDSMLGIGFLPDLLIDTTTVHPRKMDCLAAHRTQLTDHAREALETWSRFRGLQLLDSNARFAEGFRFGVAHSRARGDALLRTALAAG